MYWNGSGVTALICRWKSGKITMPHRLPGFRRLIGGARKLIPLKTGAAGIIKSFHGCFPEITRYC
jgi:hypothetical protein